MRERQLGTSIFEVRCKDLGGEPVVCEDKRLLFLPNELSRDAACFMEVAAANAELPVYYGGVVKDKIVIAGRCAVFGNQLKWLFGDGLCKLPGICDGGRAADKFRLRSVEFANSFQPSQDISQMAAIYSSIKMQLVNHEIAQILK